MKEKRCKYKERVYSVRDDGSIFRHRKDGCKPSKLDEVWTFGKKDEATGYMLYGGVRVHQVVATAFHGVPEDKEMVVDHRDTNRCNNRPENLAWVTKLENVLNNPYTRKKIAFLCGSVEAFLADPSILRGKIGEPNIAWMRTVSKEEAARCLRNLERWVEQDEKVAAEQEDREKQSRRLDERIFKEGFDSFGEQWDMSWVTAPPRKTDWELQKEAIEEENRRLYEEAERERTTPKPSLTPGAMQVNWKTPSEFPLCPKNVSDTPLKDYFDNLVEGAVFCHNSLYESIVYKFDLSDDKQTLAVVCTSDHIKGGSGFGLSVITMTDGIFIHENGGSFFHEDGAEKYMTLALGREWTGGDVFDDYC